MAAQSPLKLGGTGSETFSSSDYVNTTHGGLPPGGDSDQFLIKASGGDFDTSWAHPLRSVSILVTDPLGADLTAGDGKAYLRIPASIDGHNLVSVGASVSTVSAGDDILIQLRRIRAGTPVDMLSTQIMIDVGEEDSITASTPWVIDTSNDDVQHGDQIHIDVDLGGTGAKGLAVTLTFQIP